MLTGLDSVPWAQLHHAYGPADDVPSLLRAVADGPAEARQQALWELWGNIYHQGTVYEASAPAVPFLAELATSTSIPEHDRVQLLYLLAAIAGGTSYLEVHQGLIRGGLTPAEEEDRWRQLEWVASAREAVAREAHRLVTGLTQAPRPLQLAMIALCAKVPEAAGSAREALQELRVTERDPRLSAAIGATLALVANERVSQQLVAAAAISPAASDALRDMRDLSEPERARLVVEYLVEDVRDHDQRTWDAHRREGSDSV